MGAPRTVAIAAAAACTLLFAACASTPRRVTPAPPLPSPAPSPAPAPATAPDLAATPDAVPRLEPRSSHGNPPHYDVNGRRYLVLASAEGYTERGVASWYGPDFHGHNTSSGEAYDMYAMTAAHRTLPIPCYARVTNLANGRSVVVRINDRGPFVANRIVDLSYTAALRLDILRTGTAFVELRTVQPAEMTVVTSAAPATAATPAPPAPATEVAPAGAPAAATFPPPPVALYIQVGAFAAAGNAQKLAERLRAAGIPQVFTLDSTAAGPLLHRVRIGPIIHVEDFDRLTARLARLGFPEARLAND